MSLFPSAFNAITPAHSTVLVGKSPETTGWAVDVRLLYDYNGSHDTENAVNGTGADPSTPCLNFANGKQK